MLKTRVLLLKRCLSCFFLYALLSYIIQENVSPGTIAIVPFTNTKVRKIGQKWISSHYCSTCRECGAHPRSEGRNTRFLCPRGVNGKKNAFSEHAGWWLRAPPRPSQTHRVYTVVTYLPSFPYCRTLRRYSRTFSIKGQSSLDEQSTKFYRICSPPFPLSPDETGG